VYSNNNPVNNSDPSGLQPNQNNTIKVSSRILCTGDCGVVAWGVIYELANKHKKDGFIIQEVTHSRRVWDCCGNEYFVLKIQPPEYQSRWLEAWPVKFNDKKPRYDRFPRDELEKIQSIPNCGKFPATGMDVYYNLMNYGPSRGWESLTGQLYFSEDDEFKRLISVYLQKGLARGAGFLLSYPLDADQSFTTIFGHVKDLVGLVPHELVWKWDCCKNSKSKETKIVKRIPNDVPKL
jgi:hypothetical protein